MPSDAPSSQAAADCCGYVATLAYDASRFIITLLRVLDLRSDRLAENAAPPPGPRFVSVQLAFVEPSSVPEQAGSDDERVAAHAVGLDHDHRLAEPREQRKLLGN